MRVCLCIFYTCCVLATSYDRFFYICDSRNKEETLTGNGYILSSGSLSGPSYCRLDVPNVLGGSVKFKFDVFDVGVQHLSFLDARCNQSYLAINSEKFCGGLSSYEYCTSDDWITLEYYFDGYSLTSDRFQIYFETFSTNQCDCMSEEPASLKCVFPFIFNDKTHYQCTSNDGSDGGKVKPFCATAVDSFGRATARRDCNMSHPACELKCLTNEGRQCLFAYGSSQQQTCITKYPYAGNVPEPSCPVGNKLPRTCDPVYETCGDQCLMEKQPGSAHITDKKGRVGTQVSSETGLDSRDRVYFTFNSQNDSIHYLLVFTQLKLQFCPDYGVLTVGDFEGLFRYHVCSFTGELCIPTPKFFIHYNVTSDPTRSFVSYFSAEFTQVPKSECEYVEPIDSACSKPQGRLVTVPGWIRGPLYPLALPPSLSCHWEIESPGEEYYISMDGFETHDFDVYDGDLMKKYGSFKIWDDKFLNETIQRPGLNFHFVSVSRFLKIEFTGSNSFYGAVNFKFQIQFLRKDTELVTLVNNGFIISEDKKSVCHLPFSVNGAAHEGCFVSSDSNEGERYLKCLSTDGDLVTCHSAEPFLRPLQYKPAQFYNVRIASIDYDSSVKLAWSISSAFYKSIQVWVNNKLSTNSNPNKIEGLSLTEMNKIELVLVNFDCSKSHFYLYVDIQSGLYVTATPDWSIEFHHEFVAVVFSQILCEAYPAGLSQTTIDAFSQNYLFLHQYRSITDHVEFRLNMGGPAKITVRYLETKPIPVVCFFDFAVSFYFHQSSTLSMSFPYLSKSCLIELMDVELIWYVTSNSSFEKQSKLIFCSWDNGCLTHTESRKVTINSTLINCDSCIQAIITPSTLGMKQGKYTQKVCPQIEPHISSLSQTSATLTWKYISGFTGYFAVFVWSTFEEERLYKTKNSFLTLVNLKPGNRYKTRVRILGTDARSVLDSEKSDLYFETVPTSHYVSQLSYKNGSFYLEWAVLYLDDGITTDNSVGGYLGFQIHYSSASSGNVTHTIHSTHIQSFQLKFEVPLELYTIKLQSISYSGITLGEEKMFSQLSAPGKFEISNFIFRDLTQKSFVLQCDPKSFIEPQKTKTRYSFEVEYTSAVTGTTAHKFCDSDSLSITFDDIKQNEEMLTIRAKGTNPMSHFVNVYSLQSWNVNIPYLKTKNYVSFPDPTLYDSPFLIFQFDLSSYNASIKKILISVYNLETSDSSPVHCEIENVPTASKLLNQAFSTGSYLLKTSIVIWSIDSDLVVSFPDYLYSPKRLFEVTNTAVSQTSINLTVDPSESFFFQYPQVFTHLFIAVSKGEAPIEVPGTGKFLTWKHALGFASSEEDFYYQTTARMSNPPELSMDVQNNNGYFVFRIGAQTSEVCEGVSEESVCNGPLVEDTVYFVYFICESSDGRILKSEVFGPHETSKLSATPSHHTNSFLVLFLISVLSRFSTFSVDDWQIPALKQKTKL